MICEITIVLEPQSCTIDDYLNPEGFVEESIKTGIEISNQQNRPSGVLKSQISKPMNIEYDEVRIPGEELSERKGFYLWNNR